MDDQLVKTRQLPHVTCSLAANTLLCHALHAHAHAHRHTQTHTHTHTHTLTHSRRSTHTRSVFLLFHWVCLIGICTNTHTHMHFVSQTHTAMC